MKKIKKSIFASIFCSLVALAAINGTNGNSGRSLAVQAAFGAGYMASATEGRESDYWAMGAGALGVGSRIASAVPHPYATVTSWGLAL